MKKVTEYIETIDADQYTIDELNIRICGVACHHGNSTFSIEVLQLDEHYAEQNSEAIGWITDDAIDWLNELVASEGLYFGSTEQHYWGFWKIQDES
jgi:hypothetical protein